MEKPEMLITYKYMRPGEDEPHEETERFIFPENVTFGSLIQHLRMHADKVFRVDTHETIIKSRHRRDHVRDDQEEE